MLGICQTILRFDSKTLEYISQVLGEEVFNNPPSNNPLKIAAGLSYIGGKSVSLIVKEINRA